MPLLQLATSESHCGVLKGIQMLAENTGSERNFYLFEIRNSVSQLLFIFVSSNYGIHMKCQVLILL